MSDEWFSEFVYEVVIDKKYLTNEILAVMKQSPVVLPAWDPMGALAKLWQAGQPGHSNLPRWVIIITITVIN